MSLRSVLTILVAVLAAGAACQAQPVQTPEASATQPAAVSAALPVATAATQPATTPAAGEAAQAALAPLPATSPAAEAPAVLRHIVSDDGTTVAQLANGLTVIIRATRQAPVVCVRAYVRTGSIYEGPWLGTGVSHLTEHLVAKGAVHDMGQGATDKKAQQTSSRVEDIGGQSNAFTSLSMTSYYISATASKTMECIDLIADWLARPDISQEDFEREHGVVQRELEMGKDDPQRQMWYAHSANFFADHPASVPIIGHKQPLADLTYRDVQDYHDRMYVPQNMIFCVVGDVDPTAVLQRVQIAFTGFRQGRTPELMLPQVPAVSGIRRVVQSHKALTEVLQETSFRTIPLVHEDLYGLDVLAYVLTQGPASRLERTLKREQKLVTGIECNSWTPEWGDGMFSVSFRAAPDKADAAEAAILAQLRDVAENGVSEQELERAKRQKLADLVYSQQTAESMAATLSTDLLSTGDPAFSRNYTRRIQDVTAEDVHRLAGKYFDFENMVITRLTPPAEQAALEAATQPQASTAPAGDRMFSLPNGLRVVLRPSSAVGLVSMSLVSRGGVLLEDDTTSGLGAMMAALSVKGAGDRSAEQIAEFFDRAGGAIVGNCGNNSLFWQATVLDDSFDEALEIVADVIVRPRFEASELEILRPVLLTRIRQQDEEWHGQLSRFFREKFYVHSPFRLLPVGRMDVVSAATVEQVTDYHRRNVRAESCVLAICGNFDADAAQQRIESLFEEMPDGEVMMPSPAPRSVQGDGERYTMKSDNEVAAIMVAAPGMKIDQLEDRIPIDVLDTIISGWNLPGGWLHNDLRGRQLVYVVHAYNFPGLAPGAFMVYAACQPPQAEQVAATICAKLDEAAMYEPTQQEIDRAVNTILTGELLENQEVAAIALSAALDELYGLGYDFRQQMEQRYRQVTPADVKRVAERYLGHGYVVTVTSPLAPTTTAPADGETTTE